MCLEEDLQATTDPDKTFLAKLEVLSDKYEGREPPQAPKTNVSTETLEQYPYMPSWNMKHLIEGMTMEQLKDFRIRYFKFWTGGQTVEGKICSLPFKLITSTGVSSPLLAPVDWSENAGTFEKSNTTVDLDKITKIGVLTQVSTNNSVNKILFYENDCITFVASAYGWSVAEPNIKDDLKSNKYYNYKEHPI